MEWKVDDSGSQPEKQADPIIRREHGISECGDVDQFQINLSSRTSTTDSYLSQQGILQEWKRILPKFNLWKIESNSFSSVALLSLSEF
jgi:hypothetical protein